jgi:hypothetical protein
MSADPIVLRRVPEAVSADVEIPGSAQGRLIGGNLAALATSVGVRVPSMSLVTQPPPVRTRQPRNAAACSVCCHRTRPDSPDPCPDRTLLSRPHRTPWTILPGPLDPQILGSSPRGRISTSSNQGPPSPQRNKPPGTFFVAPRTIWADGVQHGNQNDASDLRRYGHTALPAVEARLTDPWTRHRIPDTGSRRRSDTPAPSARSLRRSRRRSGLRQRDEPGWLQCANRPSRDRSRRALTESLT